MIGDFADFLRGVLAGAALAAPVGPVNLLTLQRTLHHGWSSGVATGLGAGLADTLYGTVAALGLTLLSDFLLAQEIWLRLAGGLLVAGMGLSVLRRRPVPAAAGEARPVLLRAALSGFGLTLSNPVTILAFGAVLGTLAGVGTAPAGVPALLLPAGVFVGSMAWWLLVTGFAGRLRRRARPLAVQRIGRATGALLFLLGAALAASALASAAAPAATAHAPTAMGAWLRIPDA